MKRPLHYTLDAHGVPIPCDDLLAWAAWRAGIERDGAFERVMRIGHDVIDDVTISTVFLGNDLAVDGPPLLYETMAFCDGRDVAVVDRYSCQADAVVGHVYAVQQARQNAHRFWEED